MKYTIKFSADEVKKIIFDHTGIGNSDLDRDCDLVIDVPGERRRIIAPLVTFELTGGE